MRFAFFGSSLVSAYWNGAATYYRGLLKALAERGHSVAFYEPDAFERQAHRDMDDPDWAEVTVFEPNVAAMERALSAASGADVIVKFSGVGVLDRELERAVVEMRRPDRMAIFWDVDAPATLDAMEADPEDPLRSHVPRYDAVFTYGGGDAVVAAYRRFAARLCVPIYNAVDPGTHHPCRATSASPATSPFLATGCRTARPAWRSSSSARRRGLPDKSFLIGGNGWGDKPMPANVRDLGHVYTRDHNALNATAKAVLNINRESMARYGASPPTRIFEAAGAAACIITDAWDGIEQFLEPGTEILLAAGGAEVAAHIEALDEDRARALGSAAKRRILASHTYTHRAEEVETLLEGRALKEAV
jgi:spore maturation protein CgeB